MFVYEFPSLDLKGELETNANSTMVAIDDNTLMMNGPAKVKFVDISNSSKPKYLNEFSTNGVASYFQIIDESYLIARELNYLRTYLVE